MRSAYQVLSRTSEPPKPRLITGLPGKSCAKVSQKRIDELPTNTMPCLGGGCCASLSAKRCMSFSHAALETCAGTCGAVCVVSAWTWPDNNARAHSSVRKGCLIM